MEFHALAAVLGSIRSTQITIHAGAIISGAASQAAAPAKWLRQADQPGVQHVTDGSIHHTGAVRVGALTAHLETKRAKVIAAVGETRGNLLANEASPSPPSQGVRKP
jgi:hypothetical protein